ncbi:hypothetical protein [Streptomyces sp. NBC_00582]|uniref:hypothetical protein n=1 Tax=Streptomyces sp. NBC_00582 TaxID=2975783 RepID=UPI00106243B4|nr:hypothetical protein [Streptomyces sp. NBC_00582]WUB63905.1 hypothetical protein OG852_27670 [Streptomyces sp. NBC_00582]
MSRLIPSNAFRSVVLAGVLALATGIAVQVEQVGSPTHTVRVTAGDSVTLSDPENDHGWQ